MRRYITTVILLLLCVFSFSGCYDYHEINDTAMVSGIAIDTGTEKKYKISAEIVQPAEGEKANPTAKVISEEGDNVESCLKQLVNVAAKELHFSHCKLILFSEEVAKKGISEFIDTFLRDPQFRPDLYLAVSSGKDAAKMLSQGEKSERVCAFEFVSVIENSFTETGSVPPTKLYQFSMDGNVTLLPEFEKKEETYSVAGTRFFRDGKAIAHLKLPQTQSVMLISGEYKQGELLLSTPDGKVPCNINSVTVKREIEGGEEVSVSVEIQCKIRLTSLPVSFELTTKQGVSEAEKILSESLTRKICDDWNHAEENGFSDAFGLEVYLRRHAPALYRQWIREEGEKMIHLDPKCTVVLENFGFTDERIE